MPAQHPGSPSLDENSEETLQDRFRNEASSADLLAQVYDELRGLAAAKMARESAGHTLQATALVHEAWLQLVGTGNRNWENRSHFFGAAALAMRQILVDVARRKSRFKRGGDWERVHMDSVDVSQEFHSDDLLVIHEAIERLEQEDPEQAHIVVLKFFGGMTNEEVALALGMGERTVYRHWVCAKARLGRSIQKRD
ncbi:RNA polymerase sigma factor (TIGR02999 family) [Haloferula luteola]|uniref:RNA polymerase sigma factor (TIGR02999 family) n=1 Tax=Haloferula luteola TaxID=595692 RepID=A0A840VAK8_9BACT|nr:ECF-type sigma factor [Haloferula luteola]MBB5349941.1 RNA polymerase sigma factor (TIGR02999 family) [Haloferula luteola]